MTFNQEDIGALQTLGYTLEEARFLYLVAVHSGYFVPRQFLAFTGTKSRRRLAHFVAKLESRGHLTWREYDRTGGVYHLCSYTVYRFIGKEKLRNHKHHSAEFIRTRLLLLDFVLANLGLAYLETEPDKIAFFQDTLGIPKNLLPQKTFNGGARSSEPTLSYFVDKFPLFVDRPLSSSSPVVTFSYVDPGHVRLAGFANHLRAYMPLLGRLETFCFLYVANSSARFVRAEHRFAELVRAPLEADASTEALRYFRLRHAWEHEKYQALSATDVEWLKEATHRFPADRYEVCYQAWASGTLAEAGLRAELAQLQPRCVSFRTCLVAPPRIGKQNSVEEGNGGLPPSSGPSAPPEASPGAEAGCAERNETKNGS
jgi:hypothetical protein